MIRRALLRCSSPRNLLASNSSLPPQTQTISKQAVEKRLNDVEKEQSLARHRTRPFTRSALPAVSFKSHFLPTGKKSPGLNNFTTRLERTPATPLSLFAHSTKKLPARKITASAGSPHAESDIAWSPDSRRIAFLSDAAKPGQVAVVRAIGCPASPPSASPT